MRGEKEYNVEVEMRGKEFTYLNFKSNGTTRRKNCKFLRGLQKDQCLGDSEKVKREFSEALRIWGIMLTIDLKFQGASEII